MRPRATLGLAILLTAISGGAQRAHAGFQVCNDANLHVEVAIGYVDQQQRWIGEGWWPLDAGQCQEILSGDLTNRYYYFFARGRDGEKVRRWAGDTPFCIQQEKFTLDQTQYGKNTEEDCHKAGLRFAKFRKVDVHGQRNYVRHLRLHDAPDPAINQPVGAGPGPAPQLAPPATPLAPPAPQLPAAGPRLAPPAPQLQPPATAGGGDLRPPTYRPPVAAGPAPAPRPSPAAPPQAAPGGGSGGTACQRYPNLC